jgi:hypothetical protein
MYGKKGTYKLEGGDGLEGFQTAVYLGCRVGRIYSACDARSFCVTITLRYKEPESVCSRFRYHAHQQLHSVHFTCETITSVFLFVVFL